MRLPDGERAIVDPAKLRDYCLDSTHIRGRHKARVFRAALGFGRQDVEELAGILTRAAALEEATEVGKDDHGRYFKVDCSIERKGMTAMVRSYWIVRHAEELPRLVTCFVV